MNKNHLVILTFAASLSAGMASSEEYGAGIGLSSFGPTLEGRYAIKPNLDLRGIGYIPLSTSLDDIEVEDGYTLDGKANSGAFALMADYYPTSKGWRVSGGLFFARDSIVSGTFSKPGEPSFDGDFGMKRKVAPIIAGGYRHVFKNNIYLSGELGAIFSGFRVSSDSTDATVQSNIDDINTELDSLAAYPYVAITVGMNF